MIEARVRPSDSFIGCVSVSPAGYRRLSGGSQSEGELPAVDQSEGQRWAGDRIHFRRQRKGLVNVRLLSSHWS